MTHKQNALNEFCNSRDSCANCPLSGIATYCYFDELSEDRINRFYDIIKPNNDPITNERKGDTMTDSQKLKLIDVIIANGIEYKPEGKEKAAFLEGIIQAVYAVLELKDE